MKKYKLTFILKMILLLLVLNCLYLQFKISNIQKSTTIVNNNRIYLEKDTLYEYCINDIRKSEGLVLSPYNCPANIKTIGYGHVIKKHEKFIQIDSADADFLLRFDFNRCIRYTPDTLSYNKRLALAHLIYGIGITKYNKSKIPKLIQQNSIIDSHLKQIIKYKDKGVYKTSKNLIRSRIFELELYYL